MNQFVFSGENTKVYFFDESRIVSKNKQNLVKAKWGYVDIGSFFGMVSSDFLKIYFLLYFWSAFFN